MESFLKEKQSENGPLAENLQDMQSKRTPQKKQNKRGGRRGESNGSSEIAERGVTSDIPSFPSEDTCQNRKKKTKIWDNEEK